MFTVFIVTFIRDSNFSHVAFLVSTFTERNEIKIILLARERQKF
jgi:hypothetical protein